MFCANRAILTNDHVTSYRSKGHVWFSTHSQILVNQKIGVHLSQQLYQILDFELPTTQFSNLILSWDYFKIISYIRGVKIVPVL